MNFKPMLADNADLKALSFPMLVSPKLDGVRATFQNGSLVTRSLKAIPNRAVNQKFHHLTTLDGELIVGDPTSPSVFRDTMKVVMAHDADISDLRFHVFDVVSNKVFVDRLKDAHDHCRGLIVPVEHTPVYDLDNLMRMEERTLDAGYEGLMLRDPNGRYKFGRATTREGTLLKLKRKLTSEAMIIGFQEQMHNGNELTTDALGYAERSSHKANLVPMGVLGALIVKDMTTGVEFNVGTGFDAAERISIWTRQAILMGKFISYEYLPIGVKDKPRHPTFLGFRMKEDISV